MAKYEALTVELKVAADRGQKTVAMSFGRIEEIIGGPLPESSSVRQWWANSSQVQALAWREADFHVEQVDLDRRQVRFARGPSERTYTRAGDGSSASEPTDPRAWPWEGEVQVRFAAWLTANGWQITATADTASKARGVDVLAVQGARKLGAEVKGWPSRRYADRLRSHEVKPTQPTNQAGHWFAHALLKGMMLRDSHPDHDSLIVFPDYPRYRKLAGRTAFSRARADVHVVFVNEAGAASSDTWTA